MENISFKGIIIAVVITAILDIIGGIAGVLLFAETLSEEAMLAVEKQTDFLVYALIVGLLTTVLGGYICAKFGKLAPYKNSAIFGALGVAISLILATFDTIWFDVAASIAVLPAALLGAYLVASKNDNDTLK